MNRYDLSLTDESKPSEDQKTSILKSFRELRLALGLELAYSGELTWDLIDKNLKTIIGAVELDIDDQTYTGQEAIKAAESEAERKTPKTTIGAVRRFRMQEG